MYTLVRNLLLVVALIAVALVLVRAAQQGDGPSLPAAAIQGGNSAAVSHPDQELPPRVLQVSPATEERGGVSPVAPLDDYSYGELIPTGRSTSPVPSPMTFPGVDGNQDWAEETPVPAAAGEYQIPTLADRQETPTVVARPLAPEAAGSDDVAAEADPPQQITSRITTTPDDSFWSISERAYGSRAYYRALFRHNRNQVLRPDQLKAGIQIEIPPLETLRLLYPEDCPEEGGGG